MSTLPNPGNHGTYGLGTVCLFENGRYLSTDRFGNSMHTPDREQNYFICHPRGSADIRYATGITAQTRLESLPESALIATVVCSTADGEANQTYSIILDLAARRLHFHSEAPMTFQLWKGWVNYWPDSLPDRAL